MKIQFKKGAESKTKSSVVLEFMENKLEKY